MVAPAIAGIDLFKLRVAPFQGGFPASRRVRRPMSGNRSVASSKSASCSGWNTTLRWLATRAAILVHSCHHLSTTYPETRAIRDWLRVRGHSA